MAVVPAVPVVVAPVPRRPVIGILSTFAPMACGLATFSAAFGAGLEALGAEVRVVRVADGTAPPGRSHVDEGRMVIGELLPGSAASIAAVIERFDGCDAVVVQHEYGIYGGTDGDDVVQVVAGLRMPTIVVAHTVLLDPTPHQRAVLVELAAQADQVVVMSEAARLRLTTTFDVDATEVVTIPHGAAVPTQPAAARSYGRPTMLTWGLLGPGKGIERVVDAMGMLRHLSVRPRYLVAGRTHPKVLAREGEAYRNGLVELAWREGVAASVSFDPSYRDVPSLTALVQSAAVVVLPYDSNDQVTSGVLVDAIAAGRPVVATAFPHAQELLASGAGIVVAHDDPDAMATALRRVLTDPVVAARMAAEAARLAPTMGWPVVARTYLALTRRLVADRPALV